MGTEILSDLNFTAPKMDCQTKRRAPTCKPPFTFGDLKKAIPPHCFQRSLLRSFYYLIHDLLGVFALYYIASNYIILLPPLLQCLAWPIYWFAQSCIMTGLSILAHECGHHAFSDYVWVDDTVGFILHSCLFIPYFSWKFSHARHHANTGSLEKDEGFVPKLESSPRRRYVNSTIGRLVSITIILLLGFPLYLAMNAGGRPYERLASHYDPYSPIFTKSQRFYILLSDIGLLAVIYGVYNFILAKGVLWVIAIYGVPIWLTNAWMVTVTYLQHTHASLPHYDSSEWDWLRGALSTMDRDYGFLNYVFHHVVDTHVMHHLFKTIPHYHALEATEAIKPILGEYYQYDDTPVPKAVYQIAKECVTVAQDEHKKGVYWYGEFF